MRALCRASSEEAAAQSAQAALFAGSFIPRRLDEVLHFERDAARLAEGTDTEGIFWQTALGLEADPSKGVRTQPALLAQAQAPEAPQVPQVPPTQAELGACALGLAKAGQLAAPVAPAATAAPPAPASDVESSDGESGSESGEGGERDTWAERPGGVTREELRAARRANKEAVKLAAREKRKTKLPKAQKKRRVKATSGKA